MVVLDSDILTIIQRADSEQYERLVARLDAEDEDVHTTIITFEEQMRGWLSLIARRARPEDQVSAYLRLHALIDDFATRPILDFDEVAVAHFNRVRKLKVRIGTMDLKIAAIALAHDATLVTRNTADFKKVPELMAADWTA